MEGLTRAQGKDFLVLQSLLNKVAKARNITVEQLVDEIFELTYQYNISQANNARKD